VRGGVQQTSDRRLYMHLLALQCRRRRVDTALERPGWKAVLYGRMSTIRAGWLL